MSANSKFFEKYGASLKSHRPTEKADYMSETQCMDASQLRCWMQKYRFKRSSGARWITMDMVRAMYMVKYGGISYKYLDSLVDDGWYYKTIRSWITEERWQYVPSSREVVWDGLGKSYCKARLFFIVNERHRLQKSDDICENFFNTIPKEVLYAQIDRQKEMYEKYISEDYLSKFSLRKTTDGNDIQSIDAEEDTTLRPYQQQAIRDILDAWQKIPSVMLQMPTGTGKTRLFVSLISSIKQQNNESPNTPRFLIVTHREELVEQISDTLTNHYHLEHGILQGANTRDLDKEIVVASIQSLTNTEPGSFNYIIIDEAHHSVAKTYTALWERYPEAYKLGVTATPYRMGRTAFTSHYNHLIKSQPIPYFIRNGYLSDYSLYTISRAQTSVQQINRLTKVNVGGDYQVSDLQKVLANEEEMTFLYDCYNKYCQGKRGIVYAVNRAHAEMIVNHFAAHGVAIENIDSKTPAKKRKALIDGFRNGTPQVLVNVELFGEGFDCPAIEFAMLARPTKSLALYLQQVGRALRVNRNPATKLQGTMATEGTVATILDCVGLHNRFGLPEDERNWDRHFNGNKLSTEIYDKPLGEECEEPGLIEIKKGKSDNIEIPKDNNERVTSYEVFIRNGQYGIRYHNGIEVVAPLYRELCQTADGWFYGKSCKGELVIFDRKCSQVFQLSHSELQLSTDGTFQIIVTPPQSDTYKLGPFNKHMYFVDDNIKESDFGSLFMYIQQSPRLIVLEKRLSMTNRFFKNAFYVKGKGRHIYLIDVFNKVYVKHYDWNQGMTPITPCSLTPTQVMTDAKDMLFRKYQ